ncbi:MAG: hypothetical protein M3512_18600 [Bacteroidota bacterium]|jgi:hypothetical protein|nr:hypothetical protein [Bacteroidota bacterium]MDQ3550016.1 hypothetical protein [Bacteroidota bacterium]
MMNKRLLGPLLMFMISLPAFSQTAYPEISSASFKSIKTIPSDFYVKGLGFYCKKEWQFQKTIKLPLFLRLGNKDYVDFLEGKKYSRKNY